MASVVLAGLIINNAIRRSNVRSKKTKDEFWERERSSYLAPDRSTDDLEFVVFPPDLPMDIDTGDPVTEEYQETLRVLSKEKVLNLSGITNTDIRLSYGKGNLPELSKADSRFITLLRTLNSVASGYIKAGYKEEGEKLLTFAVSLGSDIRDSWRMLGELYLLRDDDAALSDLIKKAEALDSPKKEGVLKDLRSLSSLSDIVNVS